MCHCRFVHTIVDVIIYASMAPMKVHCYEKEMDELKRRKKLLAKLERLIGCWCCRIERLSNRELRKEIKLRKKIRNGKISLW